MSSEFAVTTLIELAIAILIVYGFMHEDKMIAFEQNIKRIIIGNFRRLKRIARKKYEINAKKLLFRWDE